MIIEILKQINDGEIVFTKDLGKQLYEEANKKFKENGFDLTEKAKKEAEENNYDLEKYKNLLNILRDNEFPTNKLLISQAIEVYKSGVLNIDKLFEKNSIKTLAQLYNTYGSHMDTQKLMLLNSEKSINEDGTEVIKKTTFVHQLFKQHASKGNIVNFLSKVDSLDKSNKNLLLNYLDLKDDTGKSVGHQLAENFLNAATILRIDKDNYDNVGRINNGNIYKDSYLVNLLLSSNDKEIAEQTAQIFRKDLQNLSQAAKNQYLLLSCKNDYSNIAGILIASGANVNTRDYNHHGETPLMYAAERNNVSLLKNLIEAGADINQRDKDEYTVLKYASGNKKIITNLVKAGANLDERIFNDNTVLIHVAFNGDAKKVRALIKAGADMEARNKFGETALMSAVEGGQPKAIWELIDAGADIGAKNNEGFTPLTKTYNCTFYLIVPTQDEILKKQAQVQAALLNLNYDSTICEITVNGVEPKIISKAISTVIKQGSGYIYDDESSWKLVEKIVKKIPKEQQVEVIEDVFQSVDNTSRRNRLLSFVSEETQLLTQNNIRPTLLEAVKNTTNLMFGSASAPDMMYGPGYQPRKKRGRSEDDVGARKQSRI
jgi:ankyrin repeat protein